MDQMKILAMTCDARMAARQADYAAQDACYAARDAEEAGLDDLAAATDEAAFVAADARNEAGMQADALSRGAGSYLNCQVAANNAILAAHVAFEAALDARTALGRISHQSSRAKVAGLSQVGRRHSLAKTPNEDAWFASDTGLLVVADGVGGRPGGHAASQCTCQAMGKHWGLRSRYLSVEQWRRSAYAVATSNLKRQEKETPAFKRMATTVIVATRTGSRLDVSHLGDSRAYLCRDDQMLRLTLDHNVSEDPWEEITEAEMLENSDLLTRMFETEETCQDSRTSVELALHDVILLCTDGLYGVVSDEQMKGVLRRGTAPDQMCAELIGLAFAQGSNDDVTAVIMQV